MGDDSAVIDAGLAMLGAARLALPTYRDLYAGNHDLTYVSGNLDSKLGKALRRYSENLCRPVADAVIDRLAVASWRVESSSASDTATQAAIARIQAAVAWPRYEHELHREGVVTPSAYSVVWRPAGSVLPSLTPLGADHLAYQPDPARPGDALWTVQEYTDRGRSRLIVSYPDRVLGYVTPGPSQSLPTSSTAYVLDTDEPNPFGRVPVDAYEAGSELADAAPVQLALNRSVVEMLVTQEYYGQPTRYEIGAGKPEPDERTGIVAPMNTRKPGALMHLPEGTSAVGEFAPADVTKLLAMTEDFRAAVARVSSTPRYVLALDQTGHAVSAEARRLEDRPLVIKVTRRQRLYGHAHSQQMQMALLSLGITAVVTPVWADPTLPLSELERNQVAGIKATLGVYSQRQLLLYLGHAPGEIDNMLAELAAENATRTAVQERLFNAGSLINSAV